MQQRRRTLAITALLAALITAFGGGAVTSASAAQPTQQVQVNRSGDDLLHTTEAAGKYTWFCLSTNGSQYQIAEGTALSVCKGSYLRAYLGGAFQYSVNLSEGGTIAAPKADQIQCVVKETATIAVVLLSRGNPYALVRAALKGVSSAPKCRA